MKADILRKKFFEGVSRYEWIETLGQGGVGIVYKARDLELDEVVAIKVLSPDLAKDDEAVLARFKREINLNRKIKHPNVARMYDFGISGSYPYITMEFVPGKDLWTLIRDERRIEPARAVPILRQIARGCSAIHELGIVHRDLKSQNVIVDEHGAVAIVDFGLARWNLGGGFTLDSIILGTPQYMSPEQASGRPVDARTDIYSIGIIAFEALTGQLPFSGDSPIAVAMKQINDPVPDLLSKQADVSAGLRAIVMKALRKDPAKRYATALDLEAELAGVEPLPTPKEGSIRRGPGEDGLMAQLESALGAVILPTPPAPARPAAPSDVAPRPAQTAASERVVPVPAAPAAPKAPAVPTAAAATAPVASAAPAVVVPADPARLPMLLLVSATAANRDGVESRAGKRSLPLRRSDERPGGARGSREGTGRPRRHGRLPSRDGRLRRDACHQVAAEPGGPSGPPRRRPARPESLRLRHPVGRQRAPPQADRARAPAGTGRNAPAPSGLPASRLGAGRARTGPPATVTRHRGAATKGRGDP